MKKKCFVGFDTSNYTTSVALADEDGNIVASFRKLLEVAEGQRGLRQSDAVFSHVKNLPELCDALGNFICENNYEATAVGVSTRPRSVEGSYMPCFLSGVVAAHSFAAASGLPIYEFSHQDGHVMAALYSSGSMDKLLGSEFIAFHVSGGTTEMLRATPRDGLFSLELIGNTADLNAGQVIDRVGVMMGLSFPCGAELERIASSYVGEIKKQKINVRDEDGIISCNLSGVENITKAMYAQNKDEACVSAFTFDYIGRTLYRMAELSEEKYGKLPMLFAGGVMSNKIMRRKLSERFEAYFAEPSFSADNAAGTALLCRRESINK